MKMLPFFALWVLLGLFSGCSGGGGGSTSTSTSSDPGTVSGLSVPAQVPVVTPSN